MVPHYFILRLKYVKTLVTTIQYVEIEVGPKKKVLLFFDHILLFNRRGHSTEHFHLRVIQQQRKE